MFTLNNPVKASEWYVDLLGYSEVENALPLDSFNIRNDSNVIVHVDLGGRKVGEVQRYSADSFAGRPFSNFRVYNPDGNTFGTNELFVQMSKGQMMTSQPFNPQWDMMEEDLDKHSAGCTDRVTLSSTITLDILKYTLNRSNDLVVQRRISVQGSAAMGTYETDFEGDVVSGNVGINAAVLDTQKIRKTLSESGLNFTDTNCTINGLMFDYKKGSVISDYTVVTGGNVSNVYDGDLTTFCDTVSTYSITYITVAEVSCDAVNAARVHACMSLDTDDAGNTTYAIVQLKINGEWETVLSTSSAATAWVTKYIHGNISYENITGVRAQVRSTYDNRTASLKVADISLISA